MSEFWQIVSKWDHFGQGIFFLLAMGAISTTIAIAMHYISILVHGWPPAHYAPFRNLMNDMK